MGNNIPRQNLMDGLVLKQCFKKTDRQASIQIDRNRYADRKTHADMQTYSHAHRQNGSTPNFQTALLLLAIKLRDFHGHL